MSIQNVLVKELLRLTRKPIYTSEHTLRQHIARDRKKEKGDPPPSMLRACQIERGSWQEVTCYTMRPFHGIGPLLLAIGTDESIHPDALLFRERALAEGVDLEFMEKEGLAHLFQFAPIPEAKPALDRYVERLRH